MFNILLNDYITLIERPTMDGFGKKTNKPLYVNVPCKFTDEVMLSFREILKKEDFIGTFIILPKYKLEVEDVITYEDKQYMIKDIQTKRPLIGPAQYVMVRVINNGNT
jgi:hypothetical protein